MPNAAFKLLDLVLLFGAIQGLLLAIFLWNQSLRNRWALRFLALFILCFALNSIFNVMEALGLRQGLTFYEFLPLYCSLSIISMFGLFVDFTVHPQQSFQRKHYWWLVPPAVQFLLQTGLLILFFVQRTVIFENLNFIIGIYNRLDLFGIGFGLFVLISAIFKINRYEKTLQNNYAETGNISLQWLKKLILVLFGIWISFAIPTIYEQVTAQPSIEIFYPMWIATSVLIYWIGYSAIFKKEVFNIELFTQVTPVKKLSEKTAPYYDQLLLLMQTEQPWLQSDLNLKTLADKLQISSGYLSQIINQYEQKNFFDFVNGYRVEEVKKLLQNEKMAHLSLLGIAYEAGFKSKSTFNLAFKKLAGITPSAYRKSLKTNS
ncbi:MAG: helix-turn-helix domain-containing protein [Saprospiraceae bacterium]